MSLPSGFWRDLTTEDFSDVDEERTVALLPVAAVEQHGPHLPLYTDACINEGIVALALERAPEDVSLLALPMLSVGDSLEHGDFPGTLTSRPETLIRYWCEIGECVAAAGVRKLILFNTHGGQTQVADIVALELRRTLGMLVVKAHMSAFGVPAGLFDDEEIAHGIHGGAVETSIMLHLRPDLVRQEAADNFEPLSLAMASEYKRLRPGNRAGFAWMAQDLHPSGAAGDASAADAEKGRRIVAHAALRLAELAAETARCPLSTLREGPQ